MWRAWVEVDITQYNPIHGFNSPLALPYVIGHGRTEGEALDKAVHGFYMLNVREVLIRQGGTCKCCEARVGLEGHHVKFRSKGGDHTLGNIEVLCRRHHQSYGHNLKVGKQ